MIEPTERAERQPRAELEAAGFRSDTQVGRRNRHEVDQQREAGRPLERCLDVGALSLDAAQPSHGGGPR